MEGANHDTLRLEIIRLSTSNTWGEAKQEWTLESIHLLEADEDDVSCLCGHTPIKELCFLRNSKNGKETIVGNVCVTKFLNLQSNTIFKGIKRITKDVEKALNIATITYAHKRGWIDDWQKEFGTDTYRKRVLSSAQMSKRIEINQRILGSLKAHKLR